MIFVKSAKAAASCAAMWVALCGTAGEARAASDLGINGWTPSVDAKERGAHLPAHQPMHLPPPVSSRLPVQRPAPYQRAVAFNASFNNLSASPGRDVPLVTSLAVDNLTRRAGPTIGAGWLLAVAGIGALALLGYRISTAGGSGRSIAHRLDARGTDDDACRDNVAGWRLSVFEELPGAAKQRRQRLRQATPRLPQAARAARRGGPQAWAQPRPQSMRLS